MQGRDAGVLQKAPKLLTAHIFGHSGAGRALSRTTGSHGTNDEIASLSGVQRTMESGFSPAR